MPKGTTVIHERKLVGLILFLAAVAVGVLAWTGLAALLGASNGIKGTSFILGGMVMVVGDLVYRVRHWSDFGFWSLVAEESGGAVGIFPSWLLGAITIVGGISIITGAR